VAAVIGDFVAPGESTLNTDGSPAYPTIGKTFLKHRVVEHSKELVGPNGENNNLAEELNFRFDRKERGTHLNIEPKYLLDYAVEAAFRADTRRLANGDQLRRVLHLAGCVGRSRYWRGYTHGEHRQTELTHPSPAQAKPSGPPKLTNPRINRRRPR
jgi:hypothetical protein